MIHMILNSTTTSRCVLAQCLGRLAGGLFSRRRRVSLPGGVTGLGRRNSRCGVLAVLLLALMLRRVTICFTWGFAPPVDCDWEEARVSLRCGGEGRRSEGGGMTVCEGVLGSVMASSQPC